MKHCNGCPIDIHTEEGETVSNYGCLPCFKDALTWFQDTGKVWACHEKPSEPCIGFLKLCKKKNIKISVNKNTVLITEETTIEQIYEHTLPEKN